MTIDGIVAPHNILYIAAHGVVWYHSFGSFGVESVGTGDSMAVVVHFRNGTNQKLAQAQNAAWVSNPASRHYDGVTPRWLVCRNKRGEVLGTFQEADVAGFRIEQVRNASRFRVPRLKRQSRV